MSEADELLAELVAEIKELKFAVERTNEILSEIRDTINDAKYKLNNIL